MLCHPPLPPPPPHVAPTAGLCTLQMTPEVPDIRTATLQDIKRRLYCARNISAPDSSGNPVNNGDMVDLVSQGNARLEGISGTVKYIQKGALWLLVK